MRVEEYGGMYTISVDRKSGRAGSYTIEFRIVEVIPDKVDRETRFIFTVEIVDTTEIVVVTKVKVKAPLIVVDKPFNVTEPTQAT